MNRIILASTSPFRRSMLANAGVSAEPVASGVDERQIEDDLRRNGASPPEVALALAAAKASKVSLAEANALVIGCDQVLALDDSILHKPESLEDAHRRLLALSGKTHVLHSAFALFRAGVRLRCHVATARMTMRALEPEFVLRHLARVGEASLGSVGAYQIEGEGAQLFDTVEGDHFTIVGLPLLPLLASLRDLGAMDG